MVRRFCFHHIDCLAFLALGAFFIITKTFIFFINFCNVWYDQLCRTSQKQRLLSHLVRLRGLRLISYHLTMLANNFGIASVITVHDSIIHIISYVLKFFSIRGSSDQLCRNQARLNLACSDNLVDVVFYISKVSGQLLVVLPSIGRKFERFHSEKLLHNKPICCRLIDIFIALASKL